MRNLQTYVWVGIWGSGKKDFSKFATHTGLPGLPVCFASHLIRPDGVLFTLPVLEIWNWRIHTNGQSLFGGPKIWSHTPICNVVIGRYPSILMLSAIPCILSLDIYLSKLFAHKKKRCFHGHLQCLSLESFLHFLVLVMQHRFNQLEFCIQHLPIALKT